MYEEKKGFSNRVQKVVQDHFSKAALKHKLLMGPTSHRGYGWALSFAR